MLWGFSTAFWIDSVRGVSSGSSVKNWRNSRKIALIQRKGMVIRRQKARNNLRMDQPSSTDGSVAALAGSEETGGVEGVPIVWGGVVQGERGFCHCLGSGPKPGGE